MRKHIVLNWRKRGFILVLYVNRLDLFLLSTYFARSVPYMSPVASSVGCAR
jgi:hypothetical protein